MRGVPLNSPPAALQNFERHDVIRPSPSRDLVEIAALATVILGSLVLFGLAANQGYMTYTQVGVWVLLWLGSMITLAVASRRPRHCVLCGRELARIFHTEDDAGGRSWHRTIFACNACRKYESHLALQD